MEDALQTFVGLYLALIVVCLSYAGYLLVSSGQVKQLSQFGIRELLYAAVLGGIATKVALAVTWSRFLTDLGQW